MKVDRNNVSNTTVTFHNYTSEVEEKFAYKDEKKNRTIHEKIIKVIALKVTADAIYLVQNPNYTTETSGTNVTYIVQHSKEFLVTKLNLKGELAYFKVIPNNSEKNMAGVDIIEYKNDLYFFYGEHPKNIEKYTVENYDKENYENTGDIHGPIPVCVKLSSAGKLSRTTFTRNEPYCFVPGVGLQTLKGNQMISIRIDKQGGTLTVFEIKN